MKKVLLLGLLALLVGLYAYFELFSVSDYTADSSEVVVTEELVNENSEPAEPITGSNTIEQLRLQSGDLECTITYKSPEGVVEGTLFTSVGLLRGDFLVPSPDLNGLMLSSMILSDSEMVLWTEWEGQAQGMRVNLTQVNDMSTNEPVSRDETVDFVCAEWSPVDKSVFEAPGDVLFYDFSDLMQAGMEEATLYEEVEMP